MAVDFHLLTKHLGRLYLANPCNHYADAAAPDRVPTSRPARAQDVAMALDAAVTEILDVIADNYAPHEFEAVARALGYATREIAEYQRREDAGELSAHENYYATSLIAGMVAALMEHKGAVDNLDILKAPESVLPEWEAWYRDQAREIFEEMVALEARITTGCFADNSRWAALRVRFLRQAELLVQVRQRLGVPLFQNL